MLPLYEKLAESERIIIAGAGGGHDFLCGLPLFFHLRELGKEVTLANLSFSNLYGVTGRELLPQIIEIGPEAGGSSHYFPEKYLAKWFAERGEEVPVWCFHRTGVVPLAEGYRVLIEETRADTVVLVDGGTDSLLRGDEEELGTPHEDIASVAAVSELKYAKQKLLVCLGFGVDAYHGVSHTHFLENTAAISREGGFLGTQSLLLEMPEVQAYKEAVEYVFAAMPQHQSIVSSSILSALEGQYGDIHRTSRTTGSTLWINPLMSMMWAYNLEVVADRCLYLDAIRKTRTYRELSAAIEGFRQSLDTTRPHIDIPL